MDNKNPTLDEMLGEMDAGIFVNKITEAIKLSARGTIQTGKKGSVSVILDFEQIGDSQSVQVKHTLKYNKPTNNGKTTEENATSTPMYVNKDGFLTINRQLQDDLFAADKTNNISNIRSTK